MLEVLSRATSRSSGPRIDRRVPTLYRSSRYSISSSHSLFSAFALRYILRLSSCRSTEGFIILPCLTSRSKELNSAWPLRSVRITRLHRYYGPLRHPVAIRPLSCVRSYRAYLFPKISPWGNRTSPVSIVSLLPCRRHYPAGVDHLFSQCEMAHAVFTDI